MQLVTVEYNDPSHLIRHPKCFDNLRCCDDILVPVCAVLSSLGPPPASNSDIGKVRANTPLELWKKVFEKTFPPEVGVDTAAAQLLSQRTGATALLKCWTGPAVSLGNSVSSIC